MDHAKRRRSGRLAELHRVLGQDLRQRSIQLHEQHGTIDSARLPQANRGELALGPIDSSLSVWQVRRRRRNASLALLYIGKEISAKSLLARLRSSTQRRE